MTSGIFKKSWPYTAIILAHTIWGVNFVVAKLTLQEIPIFSLAWLRFVLALIFLLPFLLPEIKKTKIDRADLPRLLAVGLLMVTLNIAFFYYGLEKTTVISASFLTMIIPVISVILGWWVLREKIYTVNLAGILLGLIGTIFVIGLPLLFLGDHLSGDNLIGNILIILASVFWVVGAILSKELLKKYSALMVTAAVFVVGVISFTIPAINDFVQDPTWPTKLTFLGIFGLFYIAVASSVCAYFLFEWGVEKLGVIKADLFQYIEPIIATSMSVAFLGEELRFTFVIGALLIALGVYWSTLIKEKHFHHHHQAHRR